MQLQNIFYYVRNVNGILDDVLFQLDPFWWERHPKAQRYWLPCHFRTSPSLLPSLPRCVHECCRFSMFHHIIYIISLHTHIYQFLQFHSHVMVDSCVSALLLLQTKVKIYIIHTANTIHRDSCMNFALSTNLPPPEYSTILSDASLSCSHFA